MASSQRYREPKRKVDFDQAFGNQTGVKRSEWLCTNQASQVHRLAAGEFYGLWRGQGIYLAGGSPDAARSVLGDYPGCVFDRARLYRDTE
jgi:hypothetical protein